MIRVSKSWLRRGTEIGDQNNANDALWYGDPDAISNAIGYAKFYSRSDDAVSRVHDAAGNGLRRIFPSSQWFVPMGNIRTFSTVET
jgi:hypothetical protein